MLSVRVDGVVVVGVGVPAWAAGARRSGRWSGEGPLCGMVVVVMAHVLVVLHVFLLGGLRNPGASSPGRESQLEAREYPAEVTACRTAASGAEPATVRPDTTSLTTL
jgi:hypothetical protein